MKKNECDKYEDSSDVSITQQESCGSDECDATKEERAYASPPCMVEHLRAIFEDDSEDRAE